MSGVRLFEISTGYPLDVGYEQYPTLLADGDSAWDAARVPGLRADVHRVPDGRGPRHQEDRGAHPEAGRVMARNMDTPTGTSRIVKLLLCNLDIFLDKYRTLARY